MVLDAQARLEILDLYARYAFAADSGDPDVFAACFTATGVFDTGAIKLEGAEKLPLAVEGHIKLQQDFGLKLRHWTAPPAVREENGKIVGRQYWMLVRTQSGDEAPSIVATGTYSDELKNTSQGWRFAVRRSVRDGDLTMAEALAS